MTVFIHAINLFFQVLIYLLIAECVMSWFIRPGDRIYPLYAFVSRLCEPMLRPCRAFLNRLTRGAMMRIDFSPVLAIFLIGIINRILIRILVQFL